MRGVVITALPPVRAQLALRHLLNKTVRGTLSRLQPKQRLAVSICLCDNRCIREINAKTRDKDAVTDVLSFPNLTLPKGASPAAYAKPFDYKGGRLFLGDILLSLEQARLQAAAYGHSEAREVAFLTVHSLLHLLGYDHEEDPAEEREMLALQEEILAGLGLARL